MTDYGTALKKKTGRLKRAVIDAQMKSIGFSVKPDYYQQAGVGPVMISRPNAEGEGGGDWAGVEEQEDNLDFDAAHWKSHFDDLRGQVDTELDPWATIPKPDDIDTLESHLTSAAMFLGVEEVKEDRTVTGTSEIVDRLTLIDEGSDAMSGEVIDAFQKKFLTPLGGAIGGHNLLAVILGGVLKAEEEMWRGVRESVLTAVTTTTDALDSYAESESVDWGTALKGLGYAVAGAGLFATGGVAVTLGLTGLGLSVLQETAPPPEEATGPASNDYDGIWAAFTTALGDLSDGVEEDEVRLRDNLNKNLGAVRGNPGDYDLSRPALLDVDDASALGKDQMTIINAGTVKKISGEYLPDIADDLEYAGRLVDQAVLNSTLDRSGSIGYGTSGPSQEYNELRYLLWELLANLEWEVRASAKHLDLAAVDILEADDSAQKELEEHAEEVEGNDGADPWNDPLSGPGTTGL